MILIKRKKRRSGKTEYVEENKVNLKLEANTRMLLKDL